MRGSVILILILILSAFNIFGQRVLYGINVDALYPEIKDQGSENISKEVKLKDRSIFYNVIITSQDFTFGTVKTGFDPFVHPERYYIKGLKDLIKVFGQPINIYNDSLFSIKTTDFYIWKVPRKENKYFFICYGLGSFGLYLNIYKMFNEEYTNEKIRYFIYGQENYLGKSYYLKKTESNIYD